MGVPEEVLRSLCFFVSGSPFEVMACFGTRGLVEHLRTKIYDRYGDLPARRGRRERRGAPRRLTAACESGGDGLQPTNLAQLLARHACRL